MPPSSCLFCNIVARVIPAYVVYEDDRVIAFLDIMPRSPGHTVMIPKVHAPTLLDLSESEVEPLFLALKKVDDMIVRALQPDGMTIGINQGRASGQEVDHLHIHLMPRWHNDGGDAIQSLAHNPVKESLEEIRRKVVGN